MAYSRENYLIDVKWVMETWKKYHKKGYKNRTILNKYINTPGRKPICERTLYGYMGVSYDRDLKRIDANRKAQLTLDF